MIREAIADLIDRIDPEIICLTIVALAMIGMIIVFDIT